MKLASVHSHHATARRLMKPSGLLAIAATALCATAAQAVPVIPGAFGYGMDTPAGRGGTVYKVSGKSTGVPLAIFGVLLK